MPPIQRAPLVSIVLHSSIASLTAAMYQMLALPKNTTATLKPTIVDFNTKLSQRLAAFKLAHPSRIWQYDVYKVFNTILDHPKQYGFVDNTTAYGETGDFWG